MKKDIQFNAEELVNSVEALARHATGKEKLTLRTKSLTFPKTERCSPAIVARKKRSIQQEV